VIGGLRWHPTGSTQLAFTRVLRALARRRLRASTPREGEATRWTESEVGGLVADELQSSPTLIKLEELR
jgi:hypothetical protein